MSVKDQSFASLFLKLALSVGLVMGLAKLVSGDKEKLP